ncbi:hypothetical protein DKX38_021765 [Salix brachista]|uniref:Uncharacterized protein n=1 Tax=Salix brachista TaxID=2182728 RepID=A0A5N5JZQ8_9ROSI|nr:hypothetical protein DKX38_021765 [Salix brachista]
MSDKITKAAAHLTDQNEDVEEPSNGKIKRKAEKSFGVARKKGKTAVGKPRRVKKLIQFESYRIVNQFNDNFIMGKDALCQSLRKICEVHRSDTGKNVFCGIAPSWQGI